MECIIMPCEWSASLFSAILKTSLEVSNDVCGSNMIPFTSQDKKTLQNDQVCHVQEGGFFFLFLNTNYLPDTLEMSSAIGATSC